MELEQMKDLWQEHEQALKEVSAVNEQLLVRVIKERSHSSLERIKNVEYVSGSLSLLFLVLFLLMMGQVGSSVVMIVSYIITVAGFVLSLAWNVYKLVYLRQIDLGASAVMVTAARTERFRLYIIRERLVTIVSFFIIAPAAYIVIYQWKLHRSALDSLQFSLAETGLTVLLGIVFSVVLYRRLYLDNLHTIIANLKEINEFKKEDTNETP